MSKTNIKNMTEGNITSQLILFALPMFIGNLFQQFYNMIDSIVVGRFVNARALGAVGAVGSINFLLFSFAMGLGNGIGILVSQYFGAGDDKMVKKIIANSFYASLSVGGLVSIIGVVFSKEILLFMKLPKENFDYAYTYMVILTAATFVVSLYNTISSILRALGDSKTPLYILIGSSLLNVGLDLLFVIYFHMEVKGVAIATIIAQIISAVGALIIAFKTNKYFKLEKEDWELDWSIIGKSFQIGVPLSLQMSLIAVSTIALQRFVNAQGAIVMAAFTATGRVEQLVHQPFSSLGMAISTFTGQNIGAGKLDRAKKGLTNGIVMVAAISVVMFFIMTIFGKEIVSIFIDDETEVIEIGAKALGITSTMYIGLGLIYVIRGMLNGAGDAMFALLNGIVEVIGRIGFAMILMSIPSMGIWGLWYTNGFTWVLTAIMSIIRYAMGGWKKKAFAIVETDSSETVEKDESEMDIY